MSGAPDSHEKPVKQSYWVVPGKLLAGEYPGAEHESEAREKLSRFLDSGFDCFVDLTGRADHLEPYDELLRELARARSQPVEYHRHSIRDVSVPHDRRDMSAMLHTIDRALANGRRVYVHCWGGVGRTGTVVGCYLVEHGLDGDGALRELARLFSDTPKHGLRQTPETKEQRQFVRDWKQHGSRPSLEDRAVGALLGLAVGDALGTTLEFKRPGTFRPITDMVGGGPFHLAPGQWTDDTSMALCLATSLVECGGFDVRDQMQRYLRWLDDGYLSSTGHCFDIGNTTRYALEEFRRTGHPFSGPTGDQTAGNGSLMRLAPVAIFFTGDISSAVKHAALSSRTTHGARQAVDACRSFAARLVTALGGASKKDLLAPNFADRADLWADDPLEPAIHAVENGSFAHKQPPEIRGTGHVLRTLEAALWAFHTTSDFRSGALAAVNLGDDADTTGAIFGQIAGAHYGVDAIPREWRERVAMTDEIVDLARRLVRAGTTS